MRKNTQVGKAVTHAHNRNRRIKKKQIRLANKVKHLENCPPADKRIKEVLRYKSKLWGKVRRKLFREVYKIREYNHSPKRVEIVGDVGLENNIDAFLSIAEQIIDCNSSHLTLELTDTSRVWPSAITMLASLTHWVSLTASYKSLAKIQTTNSNFPDVNVYLVQSGLDAYVRRIHPTVSATLPQDPKTVKIERETSLNYVPRLKEIRKLIKNFALFNADEEEEFSCTVLPEIFANVTEHGVYDASFGWFVIAQYHEKTGIISLSIADNGMGVKNSLISGPQRAQLLEKISNKEKNDHKYLYEALEENVSGAWSAELLKKKIVGSATAPRGAQRGRGLFLIRNACSKFGVRFTLLSHKGSISFNDQGTQTHSTSHSKMVFGGTLYHLVIPAKRVLNGNS